MVAYIVKKVQSDLLILVASIVPSSFRLISNKLFQLAYINKVFNLLTRTSTEQPTVQDGFPKT